VGTLDRVVRFLSSLDKIRRGPNKWKNVDHSVMNIFTGTYLGGLDQRETKCMTECIGNLDGFVLDTLAARTPAGLL